MSVESKRSVWWRGVDIIWLVTLTLYVFASYREVPFHGDESTHLYMTRDYHLLLQEHDLDAVLYDASPADPAAQDLRLLNGTVFKMLAGLAWDLDGMTVDDINEQWLWGAGWEWNVIDNHHPSDPLLYDGRLVSTIALALSMWCVFLIARLEGPGRLAAYLASVIYATSPVVLLNGRRAMTEGVLLGFSTLTVLLGLLLIHAHHSRARQSSAPTLRLYVALAIAAGVAVASKHNAMIAVGIVFVVIATTNLTRNHAGVLPYAPTRDFSRLAGAGMLALIVFLLLNPAWWSDPLRMPGRVLDMRSDLIDVQAVGYGRYTRLDDRVAGMFAATFDADVQYYEASWWHDIIGDQITAYEDQPWHGVDLGVVGAFFLLAGVVLGTGALLRRRDAAARLVLLWWWGTLIALLIATPFDWQRYYLPLFPALAVLTGCGVSAWVPVFAGKAEWDADERR
jgi:4-amino-4-deoxy-L-arabinose transferase-like glycosyltransferase